MAEEKKQPTKQNQLMVVHDNLQKLIDNKTDAMPRGFNKTRFLQNCMVVLQDVKGIEKMSATSVARTMLKGAFLGLDFFNKECYAIPYENALNFQTDYKGEKKLAKKYSVNPVLDIYAKLVRKGDEYQVDVENGKQTLVYKPLPFNDGDIVGAFAVALFKDGSMMVEDMSAAEIEDVRKKYSKTAQGPAWTKSPGEMYKKTVLRRLCKGIELDFDTIEQKQAFDDAADSDLEKDKKPTQNSPYNEPDLVDGDYVVGEEIPFEETPTTEKTAVTEDEENKTLLDGTEDKK
jgi:recombination protein RecT